MSTTPHMPRLHLLSGWAFPAAALKPLARALDPMLAVTTSDAAPLGDHISSRQVIGGWSLGGLFALAAVAAGARPRALVLISSTARFGRAAHYPCGVPPSRLRSLSRHLAQDPDAALRDFFAQCAQPHAEPVDPADLQLTAARRLGPATLQEGLHSLAGLDLRSTLAHLPVPTLLLHGAHDAVIPAGAARWIHERAPTSQLILHPGAGHDLPLRHPAWCAARILHFMETCA